MSSDTGEQTMRFDLLKTSLGQAVGTAGARLGRLAFSGSRTVETPNFFAITSRGAIPHITPDNLAKHVPVPGTYIALEDFVEKHQQDLSRTPPIFKTPSTPSRPRPLHNFTSMPSSVLTLLAARRLPAVPSPQGNTTKGISIFTSTGFQNLTTSDFQSAVSTLLPDIAIPLADLTNTSTTPNSKRALRMAERTEEWLSQWLSPSSPASPSRTAIFAPTLPIPYPVQWEYLTRLAEEDYSSRISGLALYSASLIPDLASHPFLASKPRLSLDTPTTPHQILHQISLGVDIFLLPFLSSTSDAGVALAFQFPAPDSSSPSTTDPLPLGSDLGSPEFSTQTTPLRKGCGCSTCTTHHAAYVHHLLKAREMLGWTLLQIHNHATMADFFLSVRQTLAEGADVFSRESVRFQSMYASDLPAGTGERPRARGYHFKSEGGDEKRNKKAWERFGDGETGVEGEVEGLEVEGVEKVRLERGLTETPVGPDAGDGGRELDEKGLC